MVVIQGNGVSKGMVKGTLYFLKRTKAEIVKGENCSIEQERQRLIKAQEKTISQLKRLTEMCRKEHDGEAAALFEVHQMLVTDEEYLNGINTILQNEKCTAEYAVKRTGEQFTVQFAAMEDAYMKARSADINDVSQRLINNLVGIVDGGIDAETQVILAADDLTPSETIQLDRHKILGFAVQRGSANSHTAILARTMGIPAICGLGERLTPKLHGQFVCMDGENGNLIVNPDKLSLKKFEEKCEDEQRRKEHLYSMRGKEILISNGKRIDVVCNISSPEDVKAVLENDGQGIGLFRSEFLYLASSDFPDEEKQFQAYKGVAAAMKGRRVVIRTLDIGADKQAEYFGVKKEGNPALGLRGIRVCLKQPEIFKTQLRALYRASAYGKIAIMFPMITSVWEVEKCRRICQEVMNELTEEGVSFNPETELGVMIETPAAVFIADELAEQVDFFSIGTNDLAQYMLACDRQNDELGEFFVPHHPALIQAIKMTADAAHKNGIWIGICGELAADLDLLPIFLEMGIDELSVVPSAVLPLRAAIKMGF